MYLTEADRLGNPYQKCGLGARGSPRVLFHFVNWKHFPKYIYSINSSFAHLSFNWHLLDCRFFVVSQNISKNKPFLIDLHKPGSSKKPLKEEPLKNNGCHFPLLLSFVSSALVVSISSYHASYLFFFHVSLVFIFCLLALLFRRTCCPILSLGA